MARRFAALTAFLLAACLLGLLGRASAPDRAGAQGPRVVGGAATTIDKIPWQVALDFTPSSLPSICGGVLVAPKIVITAAHCADLGDTGEFPIAASFYEVITGRTSLSSSEGQRIGVEEIYYFDDGGGGTPKLVAQSTDATSGDQLYDVEKAEWDAVFLKLAQPSSATPIKIAGPSETKTWVPGRKALVSGWGDLTEGGSSPDQLHSATVKSIDDDACGAPGVYGPSDSMTFYRETQVCAGFLKQGGIDTCNGDSGGPLAVPIEGPGRMRLVGETSTGEGCARPKKPGIYGRLAADPMRTAFQHAIKLISGVNVVGSGGRTPAPPKTTITLHPQRKSETRVARFRFSANEPSTFQCKLDRKAFKSCDSPLTTVVSRGKHRFQVRAVDSVGKVDRTADSFRWRVKRTS